MTIVEHVAWQVEDPRAVGEWYAAHLGFRVVRRIDAPPHTHFLADAAGRVIIEIYHNPAAAVLDYRSMHPLQLHLAFSVDDPEATRDRLVGAGASVAEDLVVTGAGDRLVMLRDPWGFAIQLVRRREPMT
jgi:glyoxylase I family protein